MLRSADPLTTLLGGASLCVVLLGGYFLLYTRNGSIYTVNDDFGCRWASGRGVSVNAATVDRLERVLVVSPSGLRTRILAARASDGRVLFLAGSGNWFDEASLLAVTRAAGLALSGDFDQPVSELEWSKVPGAVPRASRIAARLNARPHLLIVIGVAIVALIFVPLIASLLLGRG